MVPTGARLSDADQRHPARLYGRPCALKGLRGTPFDIFGYSEERVLERRLIVEYAARMRDLIGRLTPANYDIAVEIASVPERIRGYGHIKRRHLAEVKPKQAELLAAFEVAQAEVVAAE